MNGGGFQYYGGPSGMAAGANAFVDNFLKTKLGLEGNTRRQAEAEMMNKIRAQQLAQAQQQMQQEAAVQSGQMNLRGNVNMNGLMQSGIVDANSSDPRAMKQVAYEQIPEGYQGQLEEPTLQQRVNQYAKDDPAKGLGYLIQMAGQRNKNVLTPDALVKAAKDYTPESWQEFIKSDGKDFGVLKPKDQEEKSHTVEQLTRVALFDTDPAKKAQAQAILDAIQERELKKRKAGATVISIDNKVGAKGFTELSGEMGKDLVKQRTDVEGAVKALDNLTEAKKLIDSGIITGTGAEYLVNFGNFAQSRLGIDTGKGAVANTQAFAATMGTQVGQIIKQFGSGTGLSDADREYAEKIVGGKITLNEGAIKKLIGINKKAFENVVTNFNKKADQVMSRPEAKGLPYDLRIDYKPKTDNTQQSTNPYQSAAAAELARRKRK